MFSSFVFADAYGGGSPDWARAIANIKYSYLIELRDRSSFILPHSQIVPTGEENWAAVSVMAREIIDYYGDIDAPERKDPGNLGLEHGADVPEIPQAVTRGVSNCHAMSILVLYLAAMGSTLSIL